MADVKIVDIDGEQWQIKDDEARKRINKLETETTIKRTKLWQQESSYIEMVEYNGLVFYNGEFRDNIKITSIGETVFTITPGKQKNETVQVFLGADKKDYTGRITVVLNINKNGKVQAYPLVENAYSGTYIECSLFGNFFQLVN